MYVIYNILTRVFARPPITSYNRGYRMSWYNATRMPHTVIEYFLSIEHPM